MFANCCLYVRQAKCIYIVIDLLIVKFYVWPIKFIIVLMFFWLKIYLQNGFNFFKGINIFFEVCT